MTKTRIYKHKTKPCWTVHFKTLDGTPKTKSFNSEEKALTFQKIIKWKDIFEVCEKYNISDEEMKQIIVEAGEQKLRNIRRTK